MTSIATTEGIATSATVISASRVRSEELDGLSEATTFSGDKPSASDSASRCARRATTTPVTIAARGEKSTPTRHRRNTMRPGVADSRPKARLITGSHTIQNPKASVAIRPGNARASSTARSRWASSNTRRPPARPRSTAVCRATSTSEIAIASAAATTATNAAVPSTARGSSIVVAP